MPTKMVAEARMAPRSTLAEGADAVARLASSAGLEGVSGQFFDGRRPARAHATAYDERARTRLRRLSVQLTGAPASR